MKKKSYFLKDVDIVNVLVSNKIFSGEKRTRKTLLVTCVMIIKLDHYTQYNTIKNQCLCESHDCQTKWMYFLIEDDDFFEKYNIFLDKVSTDIKKEIDNEPVSNKKFMKTKKNIMVMKLQIFTINKFLRQILIMLF